MGSKLRLAAHSLLSAFMSANAKHTASTEHACETWSAPQACMHALQVFTSHSNWGRLVLEIKARYLGDDEASKNAIDLDAFVHGGEKGANRNINLM